MSVQVSPEELTGLVVEFVRKLASADDLDEVGALVFQSAGDPRVAKLRRSVRYYTDASREDLKYKPAAGEWNWRCDVAPDARRGLLGP